jgi:hypothetical protein
MPVPEGDGEGDDDALGEGDALDSVGVAVGDALDSVGVAVGVYSGVGS